MGLAMPLKGIAKDGGMPLKVRRVWWIAGDCGVSRGAASSNDGLPPHVTVKATSRDGLHEETLVIPFEIMTIKLKLETVDDLLKHVRKSIRAV